MEGIDIGKAGEVIAAEHLMRLGYRIIEMNARTRFGEIDIVARHAGMTVFVEVRTRTSSSFGPPHLSITAAKKRHVRMNAYAYAERAGLFGSPWRIDVVAIKLRDPFTVENIDLVPYAIGEE